jgi:hypothetical protein
MKNPIYSIINDKNKLAHTFKHGTKSQRVGEVLYSLAAFDGIVYCPAGLLKTIGGLTGASKSVTAQAFVDLIDRDYFTKIDERELKVNDTLRIRGINQKEISYGNEIDDMVAAVEKARIDSWQERGKHTRGKPMQTNRDMLKHVIKKLDNMENNFNGKLDRILRELCEIAGVTDSQKEIILKASHLTLVKITTSGCRSPR